MQSLQGNLNHLMALLEKTNAFKQIFLTSPEKEIAGEELNKQREVWKDDRETSRGQQGRKQK